MRSPASPTQTTPLLCRIEGCGKAAIVKRDPLCSGHYARKQRHGDPLHVAHAHFYGTTLERFWHYVDQQPDGHWMWTGPKNSPRDSRAYGLLFDSDKGRNVLAHRYSYELHKGPVPEGLEPDHTCEIATCVAPDHLEAVTHAVNVRRGKRWRR